jgi:phage I-like protein
VKPEDRQKLKDNGTALDYVVAFAANASGDSGVSKPFEILRVGDFKRGDRAVPISSEDLDQAVANFNRWKEMGQEIPVDYDHAFSEGRESPAAGWYVSLERRQDSLYATVRWTDKAREEITSNQYRFFSPEFSKSFVSETGESEGFTILAGALTNRPFLRGMTPVALSQDVAQAMASWTIEKLEDLDDKDPTRVADTSPRVGLKNDKTEKFKVEIDGEEKEFTSEEIVAMHSAKAEADEAVAKAEKERDEKAAEAKANASSVEKLSTRVDEMEKRDKDRDFAEIFKQAQREGRLDAKEDTEKTWRETFDALGAEKTKALIEQVPAETIPFTAEGRTGSGDQAAVPKGVDPEGFKLNQRVETYMREHPDVEFNQALETVRGEMAASK